MTEEKTVHINFGPQHPAAHGVLRLLLELDNEMIVHADPHIGFLHRGTEKLIEHKTYLQAVPYFDRLDYVSPMPQEHAFALAVEQLLDCEIPARAQFIRVLFDELTRILNHLLNVSAHGLDVGAMTPMLWLFEEREKILSFYEAVSGSRYHAAYVRPGGVTADLPIGMDEEIMQFLQQFEPRIKEVDNLLTENRIWKQRNVKIGCINTRQALSWGLTGPMLRATGLPWDLRKSRPYSIYEQLDFEIPVGTNGDCYDRYLVRMAEIDQSVKICRQCLQKMPPGPVVTDDPKIAPPSREKMKNDMEAMINHFKLFSEGYSTKIGESYAAVEAPKGEFGVFISSDGTNKPWRCRIRAASFPHMQVLNFLSQGHMLPDISAILGSLDVVFGEIDR